MFKLILKKEIKVTPQKAAELLKLNNMPSQRRLNQEWVNTLGKIMNSGFFLDGSIAIAKVIEHGVEKSYIVNGQHTLNAAVKFEYTFTATLKEYECENMIDVAELYRNLDNGLTRPMSAKLSVEADALGVGWWNNRLRSIVARAIQFLSNDFMLKKHVPANDKVAEFKNWIKEGEVLINFFDNQVTIGNRHLLRGCIFAVMIGCWKKSKDKNIFLEFWIKVKDGENLKKGEPAYKLYNFLKDNYASERQSYQNSYRRATEKEIIVKCIHAWNAFKSNTTTDLKFHGLKPIPKIS